MTGGSNSGGGRIARLSSGPQRVAAVGDNCVDVYVDSPRTNIGGNAVNVAINLVAAGLPAEFFGRLGADADGERIRATLEELDVPVRADMTPAPTCRGILRIGDDGRTELVGIEGDCGYFEPKDEDFAAWSDYGLVFMKAVDRADEVIRRLRDQCSISCYDYSTFYEELGQAAADISIFSAEGLTPEQTLERLRTAQSLGSELAVATRGADGSVALVGDEIIETPTVKVRVVDTIGAGDAFIAALLRSLMRGASVRDALAAGAVAGASTCTFEGAWRREEAGEV